MACATTGNTGGIPTTEIESEHLEYKILSVGGYGGGLQGFGGWGYTERMGGWPIHSLYNTFRGEDLGRLKNDEEGGKAMLSSVPSPQRSMGGGLHEQK